MKRWIFRKVMNLTIEKRKYVEDTHIREISEFDHRGFDFTYLLEQSTNVPAHDIWRKRSNSLLPTKLIATNFTSNWSYIQILCCTLRRVAYISWANHETLVKLAWGVNVLLFSFPPPPTSICTWRRRLLKYTLTGTCIQLFETALLKACSWWSSWQQLFCW